MRLPIMIQSIIFVNMSVLLLRVYAQHTKRWKRIAIVALAFVTFHVIHSFMSSEPLLVATELLTWSAHQNSKYASAQDANVAMIIFYNLFIPHEKEGVPNALNVTMDQLNQISEALHRLEEPHPTGRIKDELRGVVYYNLIGNGNALPPEKMSDLCHQLHPRLDCQRIRHYNNATESVTLTSLHEFCNTDPFRGRNQTTRVTYLHSKGSFHDHGKQTPWRRQLTNTSLHPNCLYPPDDRCDVCGAQYYLMFASMLPGNMWTAKCSYIRKLLPPIEHGLGGEYI